VGTLNHLLYLTGGMKSYIKKLLKLRVFNRLRKNNPESPSFIRTGSAIGVFPPIRGYGGSRCPFLTGRLYQGKHLLWLNNDLRQKWKSPKN
jgi:hypothetical protein